MRLKRRLKTLLVLLTLTSFSTQVLAQEQPKGRYAKLSPGEPSPFEAWCFDNIAAATIFSTLENFKAGCDLEIERKLSLQKAKFDLDIGKLNIRYDTLKKQNDEILLIKNTEIKELEEAALKRPNEYWHWWALGGFSAGVVTAAAIFLSIE
jgi:hypothetical protein